MPRSEVVAKVQSLTVLGPSNAVIKEPNLTKNTDFRIFVALSCHLSPYSYKPWDSAVGWPFHTEATFTV
jgi:hypothetical protein